MNVKKFISDIPKKSIIYILGIAGILLLALPSMLPEKEEVVETEEEDYCKVMEQRLEEVLPDISGVGRVSVMVTAVNYGRIDVAEDESDGGSKAVKLGEKGGGEKLEVIERSYPEIQGVIIAAEGGGQSAIRESITEAVSALLGVETHKIKVFERKQVQ